MKNSKFKQKNQKTISPIDWIMWKRKMSGLEDKVEESDHSVKENI